MNPHLKSFALFIIYLLITCSLPVRAQKNIDTAWQLINRGNYDEAEALLLNEADKNSSASFILAYLYELKLQNEKAWKHYFKAISHEEQIDPFVIIARSSPRFTENFYRGKEIAALLEKLTLNSEDGFIKTYTEEKLGDYYENKGEIDKAARYYDKIGALTDWMVIGPFENIAASGYYRPFAPEKEFKADTVYTGKDNKPISWFKINKIRYDKWIDFTYYFSDTNSVFYGNTFVYSPERQKVQIRIGTSGSFRAFLNDQVVMDTSYESNNDLDTYIAETFLQKGWNRLLIKVGFSEIDNCNFLVRITDEKGFSKGDLEYSSEIKEYPKIKNEYCRELRSNVELFFEKRLEKEPDDPVNYLLLAECYSLNDKFTETESVYTKAIERFPENIILPYHLMGRYMRSGKASKLNTIFEKIDQRKIDLPLLLTYKIDKAAEKKDYENLKELLEKRLNEIPECPNLYYYKVLYCNLMKLPKESMKTIEEAYEKYPDNWNFLNLKLKIDFQIDRDVEKIIKILKTYSETNPSYNSLDLLEQLYLNNSNKEEWEKTFKKKIALDPADPYRYYDAARTYFELHDMDNALKFIEAAIDIRPFSSTFYSFIGDIYKATYDTEKCIQAYKKSLLYSPTNFDVRDKLRDLTGEDPAEKEIIPFDIHKLVSKFQMKDEYSSSDLVILLNDLKTILYEEGASEQTQEILVKVLTTDGVQSVTEYQPAFNSNTQELTFDKAVTIKEDGSEIQAERNGSLVVFKSLELNDYIYLKYKVKNISNGELSSHFWNETYFSNVYPVDIIRNSIIYPEKVKIYFDTLKVDLQPAVEKQIGGSKLLVWEKNNLPPVLPEQDMPNIADVGSMLYVSTIPQWEYISEWFYNVTRSRIESNSQIRNKVNELVKGKEELSSEEKVKIIYDFITQNITYSSVPFLNSAYIPRKASDVLEDKIGDCKDVVTLFISMLREIGIEANYVLVLTRENGKGYGALPGLIFNHVIAKTSLGSENQYYDLSTAEYPCGTLPIFDLEAFALEAKRTGSAPFYIERNKSVQSNIERSTEVVINTDNSISTKVKNLRTGEGGVILRSLYSNLSHEVLMKKFSELLAENYSNFTLNNVEFLDLEKFSNELNYTIEMTLNNYVTNSGNYKLFKIPWNDAFVSNAAISYQKRIYPIETFGNDFEHEKIEINLPDNLTIMEIPESRNFDCGIASCSFNYSLQANKLIAERTFKSKKFFIKPEEYTEYKNFYFNVMECESLQILLRSVKKKF